MKRHLYTIFICLILILSVTSCAVSTTNFHTDDEKTMLPAIDTEAIAREIEKSAMPDMGYRFATPEFEKQVSAYATYYVREAKKCAGLLPESDSLPEAAQERLLKKFVNGTSLDLTDVFCTISLIDSEKKESRELKEKISEFLNSLYHNELNCYVLPGSNPDSDDVYRINIYPTFYADKIAKMLDLDLKPIDHWIEQACDELFKAKDIQRRDSSAYVMLISLMKIYNIEIPQEAVTLIRQMFENNLNDLRSLSNSDDIYLPVFLMDYLEFSALTGTDTSDYCASVLESLLDDDGIKNGVIGEYDAYGLYAAAYALKLAKCDFNTYTNLEHVFDVYDSFLLSDCSYVAPGNTESNFVDTYFADALIHLLDIQSENHISKYCQENKETILKSGVVNIYYYLDMLQRNGLLEIVNDEKDEMIESLSDVLSTFLSNDELSANQFATLNAVLKTLNTLGEKWKLSEKQVDKIINSFHENDNQQLLVYDLANLIEFLTLVCPEKHDAIQEYCRKLEEGLIAMSNQEVSCKIMLESKALAVFIQSDYTLSEETWKMIEETINNSQDDSGLYKGGDSNEDVVSFRNTYDAVLLHEAVTGNCETPYRTLWEVSVRKYFHAGHVPASVKTQRY